MARVAHFDLARRASSAADTRRMVRHQHRSDALARDVADPKIQIVRTERLQRPSPVSSAILGEQPRTVHPKVAA